MHETTGHRIVVSFCPGNKMIQFLARCLLDLRPPNNWGGKIIIMKSLFVGIYILINGNRLLIKTLEKALCYESCTRSSATKKYLPPDGFFLF